MKILAIDTSTDVLGLAITEDDILISETRLVLKRAHAERLIIEIGNLLTASKMSLDDVDGIAVSIGPGSFTGLRIGLAAVKGMVYEKGIPVVGVSSLEVLAYVGKYWQHEIRPLIRAQADEAYTAVFVFDGEKLVTKEAARLVSMAELNSIVRENTLLLISGFKNYREFVSDQMKKKIQIAAPQDAVISGFVVARLGWQRFKENRIQSIENLEPFYLKEFKAKKKIGI